MVLFSFFCLNCLVARPKKKLAAGGALFVCQVGNSNCNWKEPSMDFIFLFKLINEKNYKLLCDFRSNSTKKRLFIPKESKNGNEYYKTPSNFSLGVTFFKIYPKADFIFDGGIWLENSYECYTNANMHSYYTGISFSGGVQHKIYKLHLMGFCLFHKSGFRIDMETNIANNLQSNPDVAPSSPLTDLDFNFCRHRDRVDIMDWKLAAELSFRLSSQNFLRNFWLGCQVNYDLYGGFFFFRPQLEIVLARGHKAKFFFDSLTNNLTFSWQFSFSSNGVLPKDHALVVPKIQDFVVSFVKTPVPGAFLKEFGVDNSIVIPNKNKSQIKKLLHGEVDNLITGQIDKKITDIVNKDEGTRTADEKNLLKFRDFIKSNPYLYIAISSSELPNDFLESFYDVLLRKQINETKFVLFQKKDLSWVNS